MRRLACLLANYCILLDEFKWTNSNGRIQLDKLSLGFQGKYGCNVDIK